MYTIYIQLVDIKTELKILRTKLHKDLSNYHLKVFYYTNLSFCAMKKKY